MNKKITTILSFSILLIVALVLGFKNVQSETVENYCFDNSNECTRELASVYVNDSSTIKVTSESSELSEINEINSKLLALENEVELLAENAVSSYYHDKFNGRKTASGELYNKKEYTAAHKTLPFGSKLRVTNNKNNESVIVTVNDRGPFTKDRQLDLSKQAYLDITHNKHAGILKVKIEVLPEEYEDVKVDLQESLDEFML
nr:septal ring lytic transglycosylase RlpA family protein [uncultured Flavobacterium sp.]